MKTTSESLVYGSTNWTTSVVGTTPELPRGASTSGYRRPVPLDGRPGRVGGSHRARPDDRPGIVRRKRIRLARPSRSTAFRFPSSGSLNSAGSDSTSNLDDQALVPISTAASRLVGGSTRNSVSSIYLAARSSSVLSAAYQEADSQLLSLHHASLPTNADFTITSQQSLITTATSVSKTLTILLAGVAALSLLVGGIGVMNIMLVSVTERTREIGLRKGAGCTPAVIRRQFLVEASVLGFAGGVLGAALGIIGAIVLPHLINNPIAISPTAIALALVVAVAIGVIFGVYPASRAARLAPIDALRSE